MLKRSRAQSLGEYVILISIVVAFTVAVFPMAKRGMQSFIKVGADQIGSQEKSEQDFSAETGYMIGSNTVSSADVTDTRYDRPGVIGRTTAEVYDMRTTTHSNLGFTNEEL